MKKSLGEKSRRTVRLMEAQSFSREIRELGCEKKIVGWQLVS
jgi:hypothetical protein